VKTGCVTVAIECGECSGHSLGVRVEHFAQCLYLVGVQLGARVATHDRHRASHFAVDVARIGRDQHLPPCTPQTHSSHNTAMMQCILRPLPHPAAHARHGVWFWCPPAVICNLYRVTGVLARAHHCSEALVVASRRHGVHCRKIRGHLQNRKYITCRKAAKGEPWNNEHIGHYNERKRLLLQTRMLILEVAPTTSPQRSQQTISYLLFIYGFKSWSNF